MTGSADRKRFVAGKACGRIVRWALALGWALGLNLARAG